mmetsp:Transcript_27183/g.48047  ORF Transcript_27183/g.48047 Transcript_27183/m.48047 type:complete len:145 (-) Transcript_27183:89-523(-)
MASLCSASSALAILLCLPWLMGILLDGDGEDMMILIGMFGCMGCNCNSNFMIGLWRKKERVRGASRMRMVGRVPRVESWRGTRTRVSVVVVDDFPFRHKVKNNRERNGPAFTSESGLDACALYPESHTFFYGKRQLCNNDQTIG